VFSGFGLVVGGGGHTFAPYRFHVEGGDILDGRLRKEGTCLGEGSVVSEAGGVLAQSGRRSPALERGTGDDSQFEDVSLEIPVQRGVIGLPADRLVAAEGPDSGHGGVGSLRPGEQVEPARDENVRNENRQVAGVLSAGNPGLVLGELAGQAETVVDELDAGCPFRDRFDEAPVTVRDRRRRTVREGTRGKYRQHAGDHRSAVELSRDTLAQRGGFDILGGVQRSSSDCRGFLHYRSIARGRPKTFGNGEPPGRMIRTTVEGDVRSITLDRTECRNALTGSGLAQLEGAVEAATEPVVYLHGAGGAFCAGADLDTVAGLVGEEARAFARRGQEVAAALAAYDGAVVAGIDGAARGGGVELALACDVRVATPDATLAEPGVSLGLFGAWGGTVRLPDAVGCAEAMDLALSGRTLEAREARRVGLVSRIVDEPRAVASEIAANDAETVRTVKRRLRDDAPRETREDREAAAFARLVASFDPENRNG